MVMRTPVKGPARNNNEPALTSPRSDPLANPQVSLIDLDGAAGTDAPNELDAHAEYNCKSCQRPDEFNPMVQCDRCNGWHHFICVGFTDEMKDMSWLCPNCKERPRSRRSSTSSDYSSQQSLSKREISLKKLKLLEEKEALLNQRLKLLEELDEEEPEERQVPDGPRVNFTARVVRTQDPTPLHDVRHQSSLICQFGAAPKTRRSNDQPTTHTPPSEGLEEQIHRLMIRQSMPRSLPPFSGRPEKWPAFISCYEQTNELCQYTEAENLLRLQHCLKGKARDAVESLLSLPECVPSVLETLRSLFGRPELLIASQIDRIRKESTIRSERLESLVNFSLMVNNLVATLKASKLHSHMNNRMLVQEIVNKLPTSLQLKWAAHKRMNSSLIILEGELTSLASLLQITAADAASVMVNVVPTIKNTKTEVAKGRVYSHEAEGIKQPNEKQFGHSEPATKEKTYLMCSESCESLAKCQTFASKSSEAKWEFVKQQQLCRICLRKHGGRDADSRSARSTITRFYIPHHKSRPRLKTPTIATKEGIRPSCFAYSQ